MKRVIKTLEKYETNNCNQIFQSFLYDHRFAALATGSITLDVMTFFEYQTLDTIF